MPRKTSTLNTLLSFIKRLIFSVLTKLLQLILPIPLFPAVSSALAQAFNIDPLTLSRLQPPNLPNIPRPSMFPGRLPMPSQVQVPLKQELDALRKDMTGLASADETIPLLEKVRSWRAFHHDQGKEWHERAEKSRAEVERFTQIGGGVGAVVRNTTEAGTRRRKIQHIEFDNPVAETKSIIKDAKDSFEKFSPKVSYPFFPLCPYSPFFYLGWLSFDSLHTFYFMCHSPFVLHSR